MSTQVTPAKRPNDQSLAELSDRKKLQKSSPAIGYDNAPLPEPSSSKSIRVLFPASKIGGITENGGSTIAQIIQETGVSVSVEESVPGCDERVIIIVGLDKESETMSEQVNNEGNENKSLDTEEKPEEHGETDEKKQAVKDDDSLSEMENDYSSVQKALLLIFDKMIVTSPEICEGEDESDKPSSAIVRLLVFSSHVGCLLGKGGSVIKQMSSESGAQIRIIPKDKLPSCASTSDELVQISGKHDAVRKALCSISKQLLERSSHHQDPFSAHILQFSCVTDLTILRANLFMWFHEGEAGPVDFPTGVLSFRLLCSEVKVGGVIGKGGSIVKALENETGCEINVLDGEGDSEERIIVISGPAFPDERISAPQDAVLRVQSRIFKALPESKDRNLSAKLLVSSHQARCLLGKGGSVMAEMRKSTGAYIRILGNDKAPKAATDNEEVVLVIGEFPVIQETLMQITSRLKNQLFRDMFPPLFHPDFMDRMPFPTYTGSREFYSSETFSNRGLPFGHDFPRVGVAPHMSERPWGPQGAIEGAGHMRFQDYPRRFDGLTGGNQNQAAADGVIANTELEVVVPRFVVPAIYGEDGGCLRRIREISEAEITITDAKPGATETVILICGTPEQTNAAQSLIQAFVILEAQEAS